MPSMRKVPGRVIDSQTADEPSTRSTLSPGSAALRPCASASFRVVIACGLFIATMAADAQQGNRDYYGARSTKSGAELLKNVEKHHIGLGIEKMQSGHYSSAREEFEFILRYYPNHPRALALISELCDVKWKDDRCDSESWFRRAAQINPNAPQTFLVYGLHLQRVNRVSEAVNSYKRALALDPALGNAHYNLGLIYVDQRQFALANRHAQAAYALGMAFPGLRDKLTREGQWKPMDAEELKRELSPPVKTPSP